DIFTTERMKKNRGGRLYIDYLQHGMDKTLVAPYSPRKTDEATVAAPLFWNEVREDLDPRLLTIENAVKRVQTIGRPSSVYVDARRKQQRDKMRRLIGE